MRKGFLKKVFNIALAGAVTVTMMVGLTGCGGNSESDRDSNELAFWAYEPQSLQDKKDFESLIAKYTEETGVKVKVSFVPKDSFNTKLNSALANGKGPDVSYLDQPRMAEFGSDGTLVELTDKISKSEIVKEDKFFESAYDTCVLAGKTYGVPLTITTSVFLYNKKLVNENNLPKDWDDMIKIAKEVAANPTKAAFDGIGSGGYASWYFQAFLSSAGGNYTNTDLTELTFNDQHGVDACQFLVDLYSYSPEEIRNSTSAFGNGNVAFTLGGGSDIDSLQTNFPDLEFGAMKIVPQKENGESYSNIGGENLVVYSNSKKQDDAFKFIEFLSKEENSEKIAKYTGNFSSLKGLAKTDNKIKEVVLEQLNTAVARPQINGWLEVNDNYLASALETILNGGEIKKNLDDAVSTSKAALKLK
ncbi:MAG: extracellular solute-binding protein [Eubacterium sp.]|nr:extracellular solute-binding protein [Eubacterium sp.]